MTEDSHFAIRRLVNEYADTGLDHGEIYEKLEGNHPELIDRYMDTKRRELVVQAIRMIVGVARRQRIHQARFADAVDRVSAGDDLFLASFPSADGGRKSLVEMTKEDLRHAAQVREVQASALVDESRILRQLEKKVPKGKTVGDVFTNEQLARLFGRNAA